MAYGLRKLDALASGANAARPPGRPDRGPR